MSRFKTVRTNFTSLPNDVIQGFYLSPNAIAVLITCLSYPNDWEYRPIHIWKKLGLSRDKTYAAFNELVEKGHCIRITTFKGNLRSAIDYIFFDQIPTCQSYIKEHEKELSGIDVDVIHKWNFKKNLRHPDPRDTEAREPGGQEVLKKIGKKRSYKKEQQQEKRRQHEEQYGQDLPSAVVVASSHIEKKEEDKAKNVSSHTKTDNKPFKDAATKSKLTKPKIYECLASLSITEVEKQSITNCNTEENVIEAIRLAKHKQTPPDSLGAFINWAAKNEIKHVEKLTKEQQYEIERIEQQALQERNKNFLKQSRLISGYTYNGVSFSISDNLSNNFIRFSIKRTSRGHKDGENIDIQFSDANFVEKAKNTLARLKITEELIDQHHKLIKQNEKFILCFDSSTIYNGFKFKKYHDGIYFMDTQDYNCTDTLNLGDKDLEHKLRHTLQKLKITI